MFETIKKPIVTRSLVTASLVTLATFSSIAQADEHKSYTVTITNITNSINFTPILVSSHRKGVSLFKLGSAASSELEAIAEGGNTTPLAEHLGASSKVEDVTNSGGLLMPGQSVSVNVSSHAGAKYISLASMMLPTNDGFIALNSVRAPRHGTKTVYAKAYDAGTETNDEYCMNIPGPTCGGAGPSEGDAGEGYVHIHRGIHGIGDLQADQYDWNNPVAKITITRN